MKKFKYIVATLFVVAIGAGIFWACQKEETTENSSITTTSNKIQKENLPPGTEYTIDEIREINGKCYHVTGTYYEWVDINNIKYGQSSGLTYTEVNCLTAIPETTSPLEIRFEPNDYYTFTEYDDYTDPNHYTFEVILGEGFSSEVLYLFEQDALIGMCEIIF
mgnify:CR=1 FL=1